MVISVQHAYTHLLPLCIVHWVNSTHKEVAWASWDESLEIIDTDNTLAQTHNFQVQQAIVWLPIHVYTCLHTDPNAVDWRDDTPLHYACDADTDTSELVVALLDK